jgi:hypothetical protein
MPGSPPHRNWAHSCLGVVAIGLFLFTAVSGFALPSPPAFRSGARFLTVTGVCTYREVREESHDCLIAYRYEVDGQRHDSRKQVVLWEERHVLPPLDGPVQVFYLPGYPHASYSTPEASFMDRGGRTNREWLLHLLWLPSLVAGLLLSVGVFSRAIPEIPLRRFLTTSDYLPLPRLPRFRPVYFWILVSGVVMFIPLAVGLSVFAYAWLNRDQPEAPLMAFGGAITFFGLWLTYPAFLRPNPKGEAE